MDRKDLLKRLQSNKRFALYTVNLYLVAHHARNAALLETVADGFSHGDLPAIQKLIESFKLNYVVENEQFKRLLAYRPGDKAQVRKLLKARDTDRELGKMLGFMCPLADVDVDRYSTRIIVLYKDMHLNIHTEVCQADLISFKQLQKHTDEITARFRSVLPLKVSSHIEYIPSISSRAHKLIERDQHYVDENFAEYINDLDNYWTDNPQGYVRRIFAKKDNFNEREWSVLSYIWNDILVTNRVRNDLKDDLEKVNQFEEELFMPSVAQCRKEWDSLKIKKVAARRRRGIRVQ